MGGAIVGAEAFLSGCAPAERPSGLFSVEDVQLLDEIGETILPESDRSPGAKAARIGEFMQVMVADCYSEAEQRIFQSGIEEVQEAARKEYNRDFLELTAEERLTLLTGFDRQARAQGEQSPVHFFTLMKQLTILGYFTSEPGVTQALRYNPIPGGYDGCADYQEGDRAWYGPLSSIG